MASEVPADLCEWAGHSWEPAGGGLEICMLCESERWADDAEAERNMPDGSVPRESSTHCSGCGRRLLQNIAGVPGNGDWKSSWGNHAPWCQRTGVPPDITAAQAKEAKR